MDEAAQLDRLARWCVALTATAACLCIFHCATEPTLSPAADNSIPDTALCLAPRCYHDLPPPSHP